MPRSIRPLIAGTAMTLLLVASPLLAQTVYTWKDAKGVTHYSDAPPPKGKYSDRRIEAAPPTPTTPVADATVPAAEALVSASRCGARHPINPEAAAA